MIKSRKMSLLQIKKYGNPILRKKAEKVEKIDWQMRILIDDMIETMQEEGGVGLAAPQVGVSKRIIIVKDDIIPLVLVNPQIIEKSQKKISGEEGCLSVPGIVAKVKRAKKIIVGALDEQGKEIAIKTDDIFSRIIQHEIDHLNGILFTDRVSFLDKLKLKNKLKELEKNASS